MSVCQSFSFILHRSSSEATFYHTLPGPPFSQWTALSDGLYDVLLFFITVVFDWIALFAWFACLVYLLWFIIIKHNNYCGICQVFFGEAYAGLLTLKAGKATCITPLFLMKMDPYPLIAFPSVSRIWYHFLRFLDISIYVLPPTLYRHQSTPDTRRLSPTQVS